MSYTFTCAGCQKESISEDWTHEQALANFKATYPDKPTDKLKTFCVVCHKTIRLKEIEVQMITACQQADIDPTVVVEMLTQSLAGVLTGWAFVHHLSDEEIQQSLHDVYRKMVYTSEHMWNTMEHNPDNYLVKAPAGIKLN